jgi:hypothetical protein
LERRSQPLLPRAHSLHPLPKQLDLQTALKVSEEISGEMVLEGLIDKVLRTAIEHAGAQRGVLIVPRGDELRIEAEATTAEEGVAVYLRASTAQRPFPNRFFAPSCTLSRLFFLTTRRRRMLFPRIHI